jgi:predicted dehydrogenase
MDKIRWGVLSTAKIARVPATNAGELGTVTAIASRDLSRAKKVAGELGIEKAYGSYQDLLADKNIDAIYNPLPNHLHVAWSGRALKANKHVLCEKPLSLTVAEAEQLAGVAAAHPQLKIAEAFMVRYHPQWIAARQLVRDGRIGALRSISTNFSYFNDDPENIRNQSDSGGGAVMDIGCYPIVVSRFIFGDEPQRVFGQLERDPKFGTDRLASAVLEFFQGTATFTVGTQIVPYQRTNIFGTTGRIEIEIPFNAPSDCPTRMWIQDGAPAAVKIEEVTFPVCNQYTLQADAFARAVLDDTPVEFPIADAVANMRVIERIFTSAKTNAWA